VKRTTLHISDPLLYKLPMTDYTKIKKMHAEIKEHMTHDPKTIRPITNSTSSEDLAHKVNIVRIELSAT
jgi:hypothetical protein